MSSQRDPIAKIETLKTKSIPEPPSRDLVPGHVPSSVSKAVLSNSSVTCKIEYFLIWCVRNQIGNNLYYFLHHTRLLTFRRIVTIVKLVSIAMSLLAVNKRKVKVEKNEECPKNVLYGL